MRKKILSAICIVQTVIIFCGIISMIFESEFIPEVKKSDLIEYSNQFTTDNNFLPDVGYIPNAKAAKVIGCQIIDNMTKQNVGVITIEYDEENRLWLVRKGYLFGGGGFVIIEQDSGKIIKALLEK